MSIPKTFTRIIIVLFSFLLQLNFAFSQNIESCGTITKPIIIDSVKKVEKNEFPNGKFTSSITYIPIRPFLVRDSYGSGNLNVSQLNQLLSGLNNAFIYYNIQFYFLNNEYSWLNSSGYYIFDRNSEIPFCDQYDIGNALNLYVFGGFTDVNLAGFAHFPKYIFGEPSNVTNRIFISSSGSMSGIIGTLIHEMGHYLGLFHTHETINGQEYPSMTNCSYAGDLLCDTPADPYSVITDQNPRNCVSRNIFLEYYWSCHYYLFGFEYFPPITNYMSYYNQSRITFTNGQVNRMLNAMNYRIFSDNNAGITERYYLDGLNRILVQSVSNNACFGNAITIRFGIFGKLDSQYFTLQIKDVSNNIVYNSSNLLGSIINPRNGTISLVLPSGFASGNYQIRLISNNLTFSSAWSPSIYIKSKLSQINLSNREFIPNTRSSFKSSQYVLFEPQISIEKGAYFEAFIDSSCY